MTIDNYDIYMRNAYISRAYMLSWDIESVFTSYRQNLLLDTLASDIGSH